MCPGLVCPARYIRAWRGRTWRGPARYIQARCLGFGISESDVSHAPRARGHASPGPTFPIRQSPGPVSPSATSPRRCRQARLLRGWCLGSCFLGSAPQVRSGSLSGRAGYRDLRSDSMPRIQCRKSHPSTMPQVRRHKSHPGTMPRNRCREPPGSVPQGRCHNSHSGSAPRIPDATSGGRTRQPADTSSAVRRSTPGEPRHPTRHRVGSPLHHPSTGTPPDQTPSGSLTPTPVTQARHQPEPHGFLSPAPEDKLGSQPDTARTPAPASVPRLRRTTASGARDCPFLAEALPSTSLRAHRRPAPDLRRPAASSGRVAVPAARLAGVPQVQRSPFAVTTSTTARSRA
ncbi:hypothetical protein BJY18_000004 [Amycolatopsis jiangsuensis]|uniref:Uncharacterized protein n=1 Tax=Amycolatopsis jiangsuensis TaxID=1181879 RepID=A0A840ILS1_9PSEU|nr:hypothetical protein [Amycolatopsis jiangsuensis]